LLKLSSPFEEALAAIKRNQEDIEMLTKANRRKSSTKRESVHRKRSSALSILDRNIGTITEISSPKPAGRGNLGSQMLEGSDDISLVESSLTHGAHDASGIMNMDDINELICEEIHRYSFAQAHPHKYVVVSSLYDSKAFCIVCKQREFDAWKSGFELINDRWKTLHDAERSVLTNAKLLVMNNIVRREYESRTNVVLENQSVSYRSSMHRLTNQPSQGDNYRQSNYIKDLLDVESESMRLAAKYTDYVHRMRIRMSHHQAKQCDRFMRHVKHLNVKMPDAVLRSGIGFVFANGKSVTPIPLTDSSDAPLLTGNESDSAINILPIDICEEVDENKNKPVLGIMVRVWHLDKHRRRGPFLGHVILDYHDLKDPPKGSRTYYLEPDPRCMPADQADAPIKGSLTVRLMSLKQSSIYPFDPISWKLFILNAHDLREIDLHTPANPYCQILWRGVAQRYPRANSLLMRQWTSVGMTKALQSTSNPTFTIEENNTFLLPPVWSDTPIQTIGPYGDRSLTNGWTCPAASKDEGNQVVEKSIFSESSAGVEPEVDDRISVYSSSISSYSSFESSATSRVSPRDLWFKAFAEIKSRGLYNKLIEYEAKQRIDALKYLRDAQEVERECMAEEEVYMKKFIMEESIVVSQPLIEEQNEHYRLFTKMMQNLQNPSKQMTRLAFVMGSILEGGGSKTICYDSTAQKMLELICVPILYEDDEEEIIRHAHALLGINHPNLIKVLDLAFHNVRAYNTSGFIANDERLTLIAVDRYEGITVMEYLRCHPSHAPMTNDEFKHILIQIITGLIKLHEDGIVHRNIHPNCFILRVPDQKKYLLRDFKIQNRPGAIPMMFEMPVQRSKLQSLATGVSNMNTTSSRTRSIIHQASNQNVGRTLCGQTFSKAAVHIGDYWFLHNPRRAGDHYSCGRADWGCRETIPPELERYSYATPTAASASLVTDRADIYAFGLCVYHWATNGKTLPSAASARNIQSLVADIPTRWQGYVKGILHMTLQSNPNHRASAQEILAYLRNFK
jgi:hypothetical protein